MDYKKIYDSLMLDRLSKKKERVFLKSKGNYFESHHIIPLCKGGLGNRRKPLESGNIVLLTSREHFLAHWMLWLIYRDRQMSLAFHRMISSTNKHKRYFSSKGYEVARESFRQTNIGNTYGRKLKGRKISDELKEKMKPVYKQHSERMMGDKNHFYGKKHNIESKNKISEKAKKRLSDVKNNPKYRGLKELYKDGKLIGKFETCEEIAKIIKCSESNIRHVLQGHQKTAKGYFIKYEN